MQATMTISKKQNHWKERDSISGKTLLDDMESHQQVIFGRERNRIPHATVTKLAYDSHWVVQLPAYNKRNYFVFSSLTETSTHILLTDSLSCCAILQLRQPPTQVLNSGQ